MLKTLRNLAFLAFAAALTGASPGHAAGTIPLAMAQQIDVNGQPLAGCKVNLFVAGTDATPQNGFSDFALSQLLGPILTCDQAGRVPMFWLADGLIHVQLTDANGVPVIDTTMQVLGPSSGGGGGGGSTVDPTTILQTGDEKIRYGTGALSGFVRENGLTIGNATSGGTERANADTQNLFVYLYNTDPNLVVSGGRTGNALNDYNANKTIALPDMRGRVPGCLDDMGNSPAGRLTSTYFGSSGGCSGALATSLGAACGVENVTMALGNLISHQHSVFLHDPGHAHGLPGAFGGLGGSVNNGTESFNPAGGTTNTNSATTGLTIGSVNGVANDNQTATAGSASPSPMRTVQPTMLKTFYIKL